MNISKIEYKIKTADKKNIYSHLRECNENFLPHLDEIVNIEEYSRKLFLKSVTFEAWAEDNLIGLVASYFNDKKNQFGYITSVSITNKYSGFGVATELINMCINYAKKNKFSEIKLEVYSKNNKAIRLYEKFGFKDFKTKKNFTIMKLKI